MLEHPLSKAVAVAFFCGALAFTATWVKQRRVSAGERASRPAGLTPLGAGLTVMVGALLGIALTQGWLG